MKLCTHNNDQVYYWIPKLQPIWTEIAQDMIMQSEWSQFLEQENEFELISKTIFKHKIAEWSVNLYLYEPRDQDVSNKTGPRSFGAVLKKSIFQ